MPPHVADRPRRGAPKPIIPPEIKAMYDAFAARTKGMSEADLDREVDVFVEEKLERNIAAAPARLRDSMRETLRSHLEEDPTLVAMIADLPVPPAAGDPARR